MKREGAGRNDLCQVVLGQVAHHNHGFRGLAAVGLLRDPAIGGRTELFDPMLAKSVGVAEHRVEGGLPSQLVGVVDLHKCVIEPLDGLKYAVTHARHDSSSYGTLSPQSGRRVFAIRGIER
jgi:hypothetical protein